MELNVILQKNPGDQSSGLNRINNIENSPIGHQVSAGPAKLYLSQGSLWNSSRRF